MQIAKLPYLPPYANNKPTLPVKQGQSGVYLIKRKGSKKPVYVGSSRGSLRKTIYRHFQEWTSKGEQRFDRTVYPKNGYLVKIIFTPSSKAFDIEKALIGKIRPSGNPIKYNALYNEKKQKRDLEQLKAAEYEPAPF